MMKYSKDKCGSDLITDNAEEPQLRIQDLYIPPKKVLGSTTSLKMLSLFTGCGGLDLGFHGGFLVHKSSLTEDELKSCKSSKDYPGFCLLPRTKIKTVFANDIIPEAKRVFQTNFASGADYELESIVDVVRRYHASNFDFPESVDLVTGGFPCQDFSLAGKRNGLKSHKNHLGKIVDNIPSVETRGMLYYWMREVVHLTNPKIFIAENVKGLTNMSSVLEQIKNDFATVGKSGFTVFPVQVLNAAHFGVPQNRERVFIIGINNQYKELLSDQGVFDRKSGKTISPYPGRTHGVDKRPFCTVGNVLELLDEPNNSVDPSHQTYSKAKFLQKGQGQTEVNLDGLSPTIRAEHHGNIEFRRLSLENGGRYLDEIQKGQIQRRLTPRECALIQTFPPDFELVNDNVSSSMAYKLIGNAVPPLLGYRIARQIEKILNLLN